MNDKLPSTSSSRNSLWLLLTLVAWSTIAVAGFFSNSPPSPLDKAAPEDVFSAGRADEILEHLVGDSIPHPAGSEHNIVVRQRILDLLESFGYEPEVQDSSTRIRFMRTEDDPETIEVVNIVARLRGTNSRAESSDAPGAVMLVVHYDSTPFGPGACDDGVGCAAALEIARMLKQEDAPSRDIIFLITDGEEYGLLGAYRFVEEHSWAKDVDYLINLEARGTTGPSFMFETSAGSLELVRYLSETISVPMTSSLYFEIYKHLPNDTDFTVFKENGFAGYNFAFIGDVKNYHTPEDNFENADRGSLQHHGQNALALIRKLSSLDEFKSSDERAVYFDLFGKVLIWWPESWSLWLALAGVPLSIFSFLRRSRKQAWYYGAALSVAGFLLFIATGIGLSYLLQTESRFQEPWPASPVPIAMSFWLLMLSVAFAFCSFVLPRTSATSTWIAVWTGWTIAAVGSTIVAGGASYLFIVPAFVAWVGRFVFVDLLKQNIGIVALVSSATAAVFWLPMSFAFYDALGFKLTIVIVIRAALLGSTILPVLMTARLETRRKSVWLFVAAFAVVLVTAWLMNPPAV
ncbi:MAG: M20/M25/M40 family metallo-hydrolase [Planctomycetota bacterium]